MTRVWNPAETHTKKEQKIICLCFTQTSFQSQISNFPKREYCRTLNDKLQLIHQDQVNALVRCQTQIQIFKGNDHKILGPLMFSSSNGQGVEVPSSCSFRCTESPRILWRARVLSYPAVVRHNDYSSLPIPSQRRIFQLVNL